MTRLEKLIEELCPNGVEYVKFSDVCEYVRGITYNKSQEIFNIMLLSFILYVIIK